MKPSISKTKAMKALEDLKRASGELYSIRQSDAMTVDEYLDVLKIRVNVSEMAARLEMLLKGGKL